LRWTSEGGYYDDKRGRPRADTNNPIYQQNLDAAIKTDQIEHISPLIILQGIEQKENWILW
jgi:hypothetical protein